MMVNEHLTRQMDIIPMDVLSTPITVIGAGAIGGWTTLALAKMGFKYLEVFDFDKVDTVNMNSQFYRFTDIGQSKVTALASLVHDFTGTKIVGWDQRWDGETRDGIVIAAVDNMEIRKRIWEAHAGKCFNTKAIIDPRMGAESALLFNKDPLNPKDLKEYPATLYTDGEAVHERCTAKATMYTAQLLSGLVCKAIKDRLTTPHYLRVVQWDIGANQALLWPNKPAS